MSTAFRVQFSIYLSVNIIFCFWSFCCFVICISWSQSASQKIVVMVYCPQKFKWATTCIGAVKNLGYIEGETECNRIFFKSDDLFCLQTIYPICHHHRVFELTRYRLLNYKILSLIMALYREARKIWLRKPQCIDTWIICTLNLSLAHSNFGMSFLCENPNYFYASATVKQCRRHCVFMSSVRDVVLRYSRIDGPSPNICQ